MLRRSSITDKEGPNVACPGRGKVVHEGVKEGQRRKEECVWGSQSLSGDPTGRQGESYENVSQEFMQSCPGDRLEEEEDK